jgi:rRNA-processing protein FCF1
MTKHAADTALMLLLNLHSVTHVHELHEMLKEILKTSIICLNCVMKALEKRRRRRRRLKSTPYVMTRQNSENKVNHTVGLVSRMCLDFFCEA